MKFREADLQALTDESITWQDTCYFLVQAGRPMIPDPFYPRNDKYDPERINQLLDALEAVYAHEIKNYPQYHIKEQGLNATEHLETPGFNKLPAAAKLFIVQGLDRIFTKYRDDSPVEETKTEAKATTDEGYYDYSNYD